ncbi:MAG: hypothetical protein JJU28_24205 [Cyclobacteriaceae bacterium]|nr:hypothetical protein [Cyclobacteriaceae bacterium]
MGRLIRKIIIAAIPFMFLFACGGAGEKVELIVSDLELFAEGYLFDGSNTATASWSFDQSRILEEKGHSGKKIAQARITSITIGSDENSELPSIDKVVIEMAASGTRMIRIGLLQESLEPGESYALQIADTQKGLEKFFEQEEITFVADVNLLEDFEDDLRLKLSVSFELEVK